MLFNMCVSLKLIKMEILSSHQIFVFQTRWPLKLQIHILLYIIILSKKKKTESVQHNEYNGTCVWGSSSCVSTFFYYYSHMKWNKIRNIICFRYFRLIFLFQRGSPVLNWCDGVCVFICVFFFLPSLSS